MRILFLTLSITSLFQAADNTHNTNILVSFTVNVKAETISSDQIALPPFLKLLDTLQKHKDFSLIIESKDNQSFGRTFYTKHTFIIVDKQIKESYQSNDERIPLKISATLIHNKKVKLSNIVDVPPHNKRFSTQVLLNFGKMSALKYVYKALTQ